MATLIWPLWQSNLPWKNSTSWFRNGFNFHSYPSSSHWITCWFQILWYVIVVQSNSDFGLPRTSRSHPPTKANFIPEIEYRISLLCWTERGLDNLISGLCLQNKISQRETMCRGQKVITRKGKNAGARGKQFQFGEFGNLGKWIMFHENYIRCMTSSVDEWMNKRK